MNKKEFSELHDAYQLIVNDSFQRDLNFMKRLELSFIPIIGKPGAGKSTALEYLSKQRDINILSTGEIFRRPQKYGMGKSTEKAVKKISEYFYVENKKLVPDDLTTKVIMNAIKHSVASKDFKAPYLCFSDLFPRSPGQIDFAKKMGSIKEVWYFNACDDTCVDRLRLRGAILSRPDSQHLFERLNEYYEKTQPTLDALATAGYVIREINADNEVAVVQKEVSLLAKDVFTKKYS